MKRVVVTGMGMVSPVGNDVETSWDNALRAKSGVDKITLYDASEYRVNIAAEVKGFDSSKYVDKKEERRLTRFLKFAIGASYEAIESSGIDLESVDLNRFGTSVGVGLGSLESFTDASYVFRDKGERRISPFFLPYAIPNMASGVVSLKHGLKGPNVCVATACSSGSHGIGEAYLYIKNGMADMMLAGGAESAITPVGIGAFASMKALSTYNDEPQSASRPFDKDRNGFVMGEGAGVLVLEDYDHAKKRGANILAEVVGYGVTGDAYHITSPAPRGEGGARVMKAAIDMANIDPSQVDYINAHGTSTKLNDQYESEAIMDVFGDSAHKLSVSSTKGVTGHCVGAAGGIEAVFTVKALMHQTVPPTANLKEADEGLTLDYTPNEPNERQLEYALSNSFGFGGTNACLAFKAYKN